MVGYRLIRELRKELAKPMGLLFEGPPNIAIPKAIAFIKDFESQQGKIPYKRYIVCVGDVVSESFFSDPYLSEKVSYYIIDGKTLRNQTSDTLHDSNIKTISLSNPQGMISEESIHIISKFGFEQPKKPTIVFVNGEEDLLALPLTIYLPENILIFYGQPPVTDIEPPIPAGLGLLRITGKLKQSIQELLEKFERV